jgi:hypothetical protein
MRKMEKTFLFSDVFVVILSLAWCPAARALPSVPVQFQKENLLLRSGFRTKTVTTPKQKQRISTLSAGKVSTVAYGGRLYYVHPTATKDRILVGNQAEYNAYKQSLVAYGLTTSLDFVEETHGPHRILIQQFDGFGRFGD